MGQARMLRMQLHRMLPFVHSCRSRVTLLGTLQPRVYYIESTEIWSLMDFQRVRECTGMGCVCLLDVDGFFPTADLCRHPHASLCPTAFFCLFASTSRGITQFYPLPLSPHHLLQIASGSLAEHLFDLVQTIGSHITHGCEVREARPCVLSLPSPPHASPHMPLVSARCSTLVHPVRSPTPPITDVPCPSHHVQHLQVQGPGVPVRHREHHVLQAVPQLLPQEVWACARHAPA